MNQEQTLDTVGTQSKDNCYFSSEEDFEDREEVAKWQKIESELDKLYQVQDRLKCLISNLEKKKHIIAIAKWALEELDIMIKEKQTENAN